ncbi:MAG: DNA helicase UvrD [Candidatus Vogelbacteria bacterium]|nr:DNA helicase UvrD [Candidatus Vogelbacteria bacterium]
MSRFIADLEIHSKYARAVSPQMLLPNLALWAAKKGIGVLSTGDVTHPLWFVEISEKLEPAEPGLFRLKKQHCLPGSFDSLAPRFLLGGEVSCVYKKGGKVRRVHHLIYAPTLDAVRKINTRLAAIGNIHSDGRPILGLDSKELLKIILDVSTDSVLIPAHVWTPWFGLFGSMSGFNSLAECFDELTPQIFAVETGLSSDPPMNWRVPFLDDRAIISGSDSHSLTRLGREATIFDFDTDLNYVGIFESLRTRDKRFIGTIEFFPEEGKYHYDGHRLCQISFGPEETKKYSGRCPVCGKPLTIGVMNRVAELATSDRPVGWNPAWAKTFYRFVTLDELIGEALDLGKQSKAVWKEYEAAIQKFGSEFAILLDASEGDLRSGLPPAVAEAVCRMRRGEVTITPGYDGEYGVIKIFKDEADRANAASANQSSLF